MEAHLLDMVTVGFGEADLLARPAEKAWMGYPSSLPLDTPMKHTSTSRRGDGYG